ncbi:MAG: phosphatase PAP2 family protein [Terriglobales bacterium]
MGVRVGQSARILAVALVLAGWLPAQGAADPGGAVVATAGRLWRATKAAPHAIACDWKFTLPVALTTVTLIAAADRPASRRIRNFELEHDSGNLSNGGLLIVEPAEAVATVAGIERCLFCGATLRSLAAAGTAVAYASIAGLALKRAAERSRPIAPDPAGEFWDGGGASFPSGHALASFTIAAFLAHRYPRRHWAPVMAYSIAAAVSALRFTAKRHFPSDLFFGGVVGYEIGRCAMLCP